MASITLGFGRRAPPPRNTVRLIPVRFCPRVSSCRQVHAAQCGSAVPIKAVWPAAPRASIRLSSPSSLTCGPTDIICERSLLPARDRVCGSWETVAPEIKPRDRPDQSGRDRQRDCADALRVKSVPGLAPPTGGTSWTAVKAFRAAPTRSRSQMSLWRVRKSSMKAAQGSPAVIAQQTRASRKKWA